MERSIAFADSQADGNPAAARAVVGNRQIGFVVSVEICGHNPTGSEAGLVTDSGSCLKSSVAVSQEHHLGAVVQVRNHQIQLGIPIQVACHDERRMRSGGVVDRELERTVAVAEEDTGVIVAAVDYR